MKKINFEAGTQISPAKVTIDNVDHNVTPAVWEGNTPLSPFVLNKMQDNIEEETKTTQTTELSEALTIENCAPVSAKLDIKNGKTIQAEGTPSPDNIIPIRNVGDNVQLFDKDNANIVSGYISKGVMKIFKNNTNIDKMIYIPCKPNTTYTVSKVLSSRFAVCSIETILTESERPVYNVKTYNSATEITITTGENDKYLYVFYYTNLENDNEQEILDSIKIEQGSIATPYTPYNAGTMNFKASNQDNSQSRIVSFPFTAGQLLHKGDYLASDGIHHKRKTIVLDGTETINIGNTGSSNWFYLINVGISNLNSDILPLCSHYKGAPIYNANTEQGILLIGTGEFRIRYGTEDTIYNFKSYLAEQYANGTPVTIEYELAEEEIIPYTTEQEQAYYELQHLLMYEGYTQITCIDEIKPDIQLTYLYNNELNKSYGERFDKVEDSINELEKGEIYSTEEQEIGKWIDGKPLYRRTIILDKPSSIEISNINEYNLLYDNDSFWSKLDFAMIDKTHSFILSNTVNNFNNATLTQGISGTQNENWWFDLRSYNKVNKTIQVCIGQTLINRFWKIYATLEYTKTTD